jgi:hypothetical protein
MPNPLRRFSGAAKRGSGIGEVFWAKGVAPKLRLVPALALAPVLAVALIMPGQRERRQPGFAAQGPELVGGDEPVGLIERAEMDFDLGARAAEDGGAALGAEMAASIMARLALDADGGFAEDGGGVKQGAVVLCGNRGNGRGRPGQVRPMR